MWSNAMEIRLCSHLIMTINNLAKNEEMSIRVGLFLKNLQHAKHAASTFAI